MLYRGMYTDTCFRLLPVYLHATLRFPTRRVFDFSQASVNFEDPEGYFELEGRVELVHRKCPPKLGAVLVPVTISM